MALDKFLEVAYGKTKEAEDKAHLVELMMKLPNEELMKIASGEIKLSHYGSYGPGGGSGDWIQEFRGSPLFENAMALEQEDLQMQMQEQQRRQQNRETWDAQDSQRDAVCLKKRILSLQLAQWQEQNAVPTHEQAEAAEHASVPAAVAPQAEAAMAVPKTAAELTTEGREKIKGKNFALSSEQSDTGKPAYPIEDKSHAANALARVKQFGSASEKAEVYKDVAKKYPGLAMRSSVEAVKEKAKNAAALEPRDLLALAALGVPIGAAAGALQGEQIGRPLGGAVRGGLGAGLGAIGGGLLGGLPGALFNKPGLAALGATVGAGLGGVSDYKRHMKGLKPQEVVQRKEGSAIYPPVSKGGKTMSLKPTEDVAAHSSTGSEVSYGKKTAMAEAADWVGRIMAHTDFEKAGRVGGNYIPAASKGLGRVGELLTGSRLKKLEQYAEKGKGKHFTEGIRRRGPVIGEKINVGLTRGAAGATALGAGAVGHHALKKRDEKGKEAFDKQALNPLQALKNIGQLGAHLAVKNPTMAGAALGAAGGAIAGGPGNRMGGALGGAALGGTAGHFAPRLPGLGGGAKASAAPVPAAAAAIKPVAPMPKRPASLPGSAPSNVSTLRAPPLLAPEVGDFTLKAAMQQLRFKATLERLQPSLGVS